MIRRSPVVAAAAILSIALGIGANAAVFSLIDALDLRRLAVAAPEQLVRLADSGGDAFTFAAFDRLRAARLPVGVVAMSKMFARGGQIEERGETANALVQFVTENYFDLLGVRLARGRAFHASGDPVAVISDSYWRQHFGASDDALGARIRFGKTDFIVAGVAAPAFRGTQLDLPTDVWLPFDAVVPAAAQERTRGRWMLVMARLRPGASAGARQVAAEASAILGKPITAVSGATGYSTLRDRFSRPLLLVEIVVALVLLITCANLANLMLARTSARARELAVRRAIGASRWRVARQLVTESLALSVAGSVFAILVAYVMHGGLLHFLPAEQSPALANLRFSVNARLLAFTALLAAVTCLLFGLAPAMIATRADEATELRAGSSTGSRSRTWVGRAILVTEIAMCVLMLMVGGVFLRSVHNLRSQQTGYRERGLLVADVEFPRAYDEARRSALIEALRARVAQLPGVDVAAFSHIGQLTGHSIDFPIRVLGGPAVDSASAVASVLRVSPGFFAAMGTGLVAGRDFAPSDDPRAVPVAIVNQEFARRFLAAGNRLGQRFVQDDGSPSPAPIEVVGVVENAKWLDLREQPAPMYYRPYRQDSGAPAVRLALRSSQNLEVLAAALAREARALDRAIMLRNIGPFGVVVDGTLTVERLVSQASAALGVLALAIAAIGLYAVLAYQVNQRRREIAVRITLGAQPGSVEAMVLRESVVLLAIGCCIGVPASLLATRVGASLLFGVRSTDPATIVAVLGVLAAATLAAAYVPARRAAGIDPAIALREE